MAATTAEGTAGASNATPQAFVHPDNDKSGERIDNGTLMPIPINGPSMGDSLSGGQLVEAGQPSGTGRPTTTGFTSEPFAVVQPNTTRPSSVIDGGTNSGANLLEREPLLTVEHQATGSNASIQVSTGIGPAIPSQLQRGTRPGRRARSGPDFRHAPMEESAILRAIHRAEGNQEGPIFYPHIGLTFNSAEEAKDFYNLYSWEKGFGVRTGRDRKNNSPYRTRLDIVCSCEGRNRNPRTSSIRSNCTAHIRLHRRSDHSWYITRVDDTYNHKLSVGYAETKQWPSHGNIDATTKDFIKKLRENNMSLGRICNVLGLTDRTPVTGMRRETVKSICASLARESLKDDMGKTLALLESMKDTDAGLEVRFQLDSDRRLKTMLWCTGKNRVDYQNFGDAISFDTTYRTNLYSLPFGLFMGVNNHFQSVVFGGVLFTHEKTEDFTWAFTTFVKLMGGKAPTTMLTDQCAAMAKAMRSCMKQTTHRWCRWHVLKDAKKRLGNVYSKKKLFKKEFNKLITEETDPAAFEKKWTALITRFRLKKNKFLRRLYKHKERWAKPYFMNVFCAGMTSTQRSESANHMLKRYIQKAAPMHLFVSKFNEFQADRNDCESKQEHVTHQVKLKLRVGVPIEKHAYYLYTRAMYEKFYDELYESGCLGLEKTQEKGEYVITDPRNEDFDEPLIYKVKYPTNMKITCQCGLWEHMGMLCRHAIKVLVHEQVHEIPYGNILPRWEKDRVTEKLPGEVGELMAVQDDAARKRLLLKRAFELANQREKLSDDAFSDAMAALRPTDMPEPADADQPFAIRYEDFIPTASRPVDCPPRTIKGGRPPSSGLKAFLNTQKKQKPSRPPSQVADWPIEENPPKAKKRRLSQIN